MGEFKMPALGADMDAGILVEWLVKPGDRVKRGDIVCVVETQKGAIDVEIYETGVITEILVGVGTTVPVDTVLARVRTDDAPAEQPAAALPPPAPARPRVAPRARQLAAQHGIDLATITGTGPDGSITGEDVERAAAGAKRKTPSTASTASMRDAIAAAMSRSKREIPHYYLAHTVDLEPALARLEAFNAALPIARQVLPVALFVHAVALALADAPELSGWMKDGAFVPAARPCIGLAVALRGGGLVNPGLFDADRKPLVELMAEIRDVIGRARAGGLRASELSDPSITVTSLGDQGVDEVFAVIQPPQVAIVGFGAIAKRAWVVGDAVVPRRVVEVTLAADHRVSDGHRGARFLARIARILNEMETQ